jgi:hypothetical protein
MNGVDADYARRVHETCRQAAARVRLIARGYPLAVEEQRFKCWPRRVEMTGRVTPKTAPGVVRDAIISSIRWHHRRATRACCPALGQRPTDWPRRCNIGHPARAADCAD